MGKKGIRFLFRPHPRGLSSKRKPKKEGDYPGKKATFGGGAERGLCLPEKFGKKKKGGKLGKKEDGGTGGRVWGTPPLKGFFRVVFFFWEKGGKIGEKPFYRVYSF